MTNLCAGVVNISAVDTVGQITLAKTYVDSICNEVPAVTVAYSVKRMGGAVPQIRVSTDATNVAIDLSLASATSYPVTLSLDFEGMFTIQTPTAGATALTNSTVVNIP